MQGENVMNQTETDVALRENLASYLAGDISLKHFSAFFVTSSWLVERLGETREFADEIYLRLAEFSNGDWDEDELKKILRPLLETVDLRDAKEVSIDVRGSD